MNYKEVIDWLKENGSDSESCEYYNCFSKDEMYGLMNAYGFTLKEEVRGEYPGKDGYLIYTKGSKHYMITFYDDSYNSGYVQNIKEVSPQIKTVTEYK